MSELPQLSWSGRPPVRRRGGNQPRTPRRGCTATPTGTIGNADGARNLLVTGTWQNTVDALHDQLTGTVKCVYADPPYGTGRTDLGYDDTNHDRWLHDLYDLIRTSRSLLTADGTFWLHLDAAHAHHAQVLCDEVFGVRHMVGHVVWQRTYAVQSHTNRLSTGFDHLLVYRRTHAHRPNKIPRPLDADTDYATPDGDARPWRRDNLTAPGASTHPAMVYGLQSPFTGQIYYPRPGTHWRFSRARMLTELAGWGITWTEKGIDDQDVRARLIGTGEPVLDVPALLIDGDLEQARETAARVQETGPWPGVFFGTTGAHRPQRKTYRCDGVAASAWWPATEVGHTDEATEELKALGLRFATPKPERLLERVLTIATDPGDLVLDPFAGSGTTAAVAHKMGRSWVTCEQDAATVRDVVEPRLAAVVDGTDTGGVSSAWTWQSRGQLPAGVSTADARVFRSVLDRLTRDAAGLDADTLSRLRSAAGVRKVPARTWHGGGGYSKLTVSPPAAEH